MSTRFFFRAARTDHSRGFVLISVLVVALLYFALLELMLIEATQAMRAAQRFRSRVVAHVMAENAAELAAHQLVFSNGKRVAETQQEGTMAGESRRLINNRFEIRASGEATGSTSQRATVALFGHLEGSSVRIDRAIHSQ